jgi:Spy/CpxP family protein refolding chaperone
MKTIRPLFPALVLLASVAAGAFAADTPSTATGAPTAPPGGHHWGHRGHQFGPMHVLHKLNLSPEQKAQIKLLMTSAHTDSKTLMTSDLANRQSLASTAPTDSAYPDLLATAKANAATRVQKMSDLWGQVYTLLTPEQKAQIPSILAAERQQMEARRAAWQAAHPQS